MQRFLSDLSTVNASAPNVHIVREDDRAKRYIANRLTRPYKAEKRIDGAKSRSKGTPPTGAGNVYVASGADILDGFDRG